MVADEQRHEVAERLREAALHDKRLGSVLFPHLLSDLVGTEHKLNMVENDAVLLNTLADLIEPSERTCHFEKVVDNEPLDVEFRTNPVIYYVCSECGVECAEPSRYCHNCGARAE